MNTATIELPQDVYELAAQTARARHIGLSDFVSEAVAKTAAPSQSVRGFGALADLHEENKRIQALIDEEFGPPGPQTVAL